MASNLEKALSFKLEAFNFLYVLCDYETLLKKNISLKFFVDLCKKKDVKIIQYRDKISSLQEQKTNLLYLKSQLNIPIIINDKIELIEFADGLHLGQEDLEKILLQYNFSSHCFYKDYSGNFRILEVKK